MSAFGPKQTGRFAPHTSAFGGNADMTVCWNSLSLSRTRRACVSVGSRGEHFWSGSWVLNRTKAGPSAWSYARGVYVKTGSHANKRVKTEKSWLRHQHTLAYILTYTISENR